jgi:hypothetical protein
VLALATFGLHGARNGLHLHRGGLGKAQFLHGLQQFRRKAKLDEAIRLCSHFGLYLGRCAGVGKFRDVLRKSLGRKGFGRRKFALHFKSVGHFLISHESTARNAGASFMVKKHQPSNEAGASWRFGGPSVRLAAASGTGSGV